MKRFQSLVDREMRYLSEIGGLFQDSMLKGVDPPEFQWETFPPSELVDFATEELRTLLVPSEVTTTV
jgi:hypothetical protein